MADRPDTNTVSEQRALELAGLTRSTWQRWAQAGLLRQPVGGRHGRAALLEAVTVRAVRDHFSAAESSAVWAYARRGGVVADLMEKAEALGAGDRLDLVLDPATGSVTPVQNDIELVAAVRFEGRGRTIIVICMGEELRRVQEGFVVFAEGPGSVTSLRSA